MKRDIHGHEQRYKNWKENALQYGVDELTKENSDILIRYVCDMEIGANVSKKNKRGPRGYPRLNNLCQRIRQLMILFQDRGISDLTKISEIEATRLFSDMSTGVIKTRSNGIYRTSGDYAKCFSAFWHWWMKVNRKQEKMILDVSEEIDKKSEQGAFVYLTKENLEEMLPYFDKDEQLILLFVFDSLIRSPTELLSLQVKDIYKRNDSIHLNIPDDISKTFGRNFNLIYCGKAIMDYLSEKQLKPEDYLFNFDPNIFYEKMQKVAKQLWRDTISHPFAKGKFGELTLYDLRHSGAIHLRVLALKNTKISLDSIRQRGGWKDFKMLNYYTKFIGIDGSIDKDELLIEEDRTKLEDELDDLRKQNVLMAQRFSSLLEIMKENPQEMKSIAIKSKEKLNGLFNK